MSQKGSETKIDYQPQWIAPAVYGCLLPFSPLILLIAWIGIRNFDLDTLTPSTNEEISRILPGMTKAEVIEILGRPDGRDSDDNCWHYYRSGDWDPYWISFDDDGRVSPVLNSIAGS